MFLTQRKREIIHALSPNGLELAELTARFSHSTGPMRDEMRALRSEQLVKVDGDLWELTALGRRQVLQDQQLELRGISA